MIPIVMAGGFGTRIRPLSANRPKPMLAVVNRPILERVLLHLRGFGMEEAVLLTYYDPDKIRAHFGDGEKLGMRLHYFNADQDYGTAGAVAHGSDRAASDTYLVLSGDVICDFDLGAILDFHRSKGASVTIGLTRVPNPLQFGIVIIDAEGRVRRFLEKPTWGEVFSDTVNTGIYVLESRVLAHVPRNESFDFSRDLFPRLLEAGELMFGHVSRGYWRDIGDPESYLAGHGDFFDGTLRIVPPGQLSQLGGKPLWIEGESALDQSVEVRGTVVIAPGCVVGPGARLQDVVLGPGVRVGAGAELRRTVAWEEARVEEGARVENAVLGARVQVGAGCVVEPGAIVADDTVLGQEVRVKENVKIWPSKVVEDHAVVHSNLVYAERWRTSAFEEGAVTGLTNLELTPEVSARLGAAYATLLQPGSTVLSTRDDHPASRMLRRAFFGGVSSAGVNMVDLGMLPTPVMRHKLEGFGELGGVSFQQVLLVRGMTSIRFFDEHGLDISTSFSKSVERVFLREEFRRASHQEIGSIFEQPRIVDFYAEAFLKALPVADIRARKLRVVVDYAHSPAVVVLPRLLAELGCDVITLNAHTEGMREGPLASDLAVAPKRLATIAASLEADLGVWLYPSGERLIVVGSDKRVWADMDLAALMVGAVVAAGLPPGEVVMPTFAPSTFRQALEGGGHRLREVLSAPRALTEASRGRDVIFASSGEGDFILPALHHVPDAMFAMARLLELLVRCGRPLTEVAAYAPPVPVAHATLPCPLERKGEVMRRFAETVQGQQVSYLEGIKVTTDDGWVLLRPDRVAPLLHLHAEAASLQAARAVLQHRRAEIAKLVRRS
ncbi:MAG TPA: sugar phosphate nucleotidyltransferase [Thermoanaerobaculaceae bacterium]|nr:sugar phosphate nucleotidyltransferase [Thermoanaerobaculaceae bacterium]HRS14960.1 sugar phosphate nucleotidyltransferase [Thermoanaerobaculaceae bacterium]